MKEVEKSGVGYLVFEKLEGMRGLRHGVSRRRQGKEASAGNCVEEELNFSLDDPERAARARERFCGALGLAAGAVVRPRQVHGAKVAAVREAGQAVGRVDAVCTDLKDVPLMAVGADCPLILVYEPTAEVVGLAHAGWRGTVQKIAARLVKRMRQEFGGEPGRMMAGIGPGICRRCYEVGEEVIDEFNRQFINTSGFIVERCRGDAGGTDDQGCRRDGGGANGGLRTRREFTSNRSGDFTSGAGTFGGLRAHPTRWHLDLGRANREQLIKAGLAAENIEESGCCTFEQGDWFYSYRRQGEQAGRHALLAGLV